jgi:hypothetical protein
MGFKWLVRIHQTVPVTASKKAAAAPFASSPSTETQASSDLSAPAGATADSSDPWREHASASLAPKPAPGIPTATEDATPSFEDRVIQLRDYYDVHGHLRVPRGYKGGRGKDMGIWVTRIRER